MRTYTPKPGEIARAWHVIDATDVEDDVRESMRLIRESPYLLSREVRGTVYDVATGELREVR